MRKNTLIRIGVSVATSLIGTALATMLKTNRDIKKVEICNCINE